MNLLMRRIVPAIMLGLMVLIVASMLQSHSDGIVWDSTSGGRINAVAATGDGQKFAVGSSDNLLVVYEFVGNAVWTFAAENSVLGADMTPDGQWTAVASEDRNVYLLDVGGLEKWRYKAQRSMVNAAVANDGSLVAGTSNDNFIYALDSAGELLWQDNVGVRVEGIDIYGTGDNARVVTGTNTSRITIYSRTGQRLLETRLDYAIRDLAVTANGGRVAVGTEDGTVTLIHGGNGDVLWQVAAGATVNGIAISQGGEVILAGTDQGQALLIDGEGQVLQTFTHPTALADVALSADGAMLVIASEDGYSQLIDRQLAAVADQDQTAQRNRTISGSLGVLLLGIVSAGWTIRNTERGQQFWRENMEGPRRLLRSIWRAKLSYLFILPTIFLLATFNYYPAFSGLYHAFTDWNPGATTTWVGLDNFQYLLQDRFFWAGFGNAIILVIVSIVRVITIPLLIAELVFHVRNAAMRYLFRTLFIVPIVLPLVVQISVWNNIYEPTIGLLNQTLIALGLEQWTQVWYGDARVALLAIIFIGFPWVDPFALLVYYGGLISISDEIFDASEVDGASGLRRFWHIDLPLVFGQMRLLVILTFIATVQTFELVFLTTGGGPGASTYTPALELYLMATRLDKLGVASAIGIILFVIILTGTIFSYRARRQMAVEGQA